MYNEILNLILCSLLDILLPFVMVYSVLKIFGLSDVSDKVELLKMRVEMLESVIANQAKAAEIRKAVAEEIRTNNNL